MSLFIVWESTPYFYLTIAGGSLLIILLLITQGKHDSLLEKAYNDYYAGSEWKTPAGESVTIVTANSEGSEAIVKFADGYQQAYRLWLLRPPEGFERIEEPKDVYQSDVLLEAASKTEWVQLDGTKGIVRGARRHQIGTEVGFVDYITLKTEKGTKEYERNYLTPIIKET